MLWVGLLLALHFALALWVATKNSVSFDENFHLPAGVVALTRGDFTSSYAQPPLARELCGAAALAAGARLPDPASEAPGDERRLGESFMRRNADRFTRVFMAGRAVVALMSVMLAWLLWRLATRWYGARAGLLALAAWTFAPEALAHASVVGVDMPTALTGFGAVIAGHAWLRTGRWRAWAASAAWIAAAFLVRFSAVQLLLVLVVLAALLAWRGRLASAPRTVLGLALLGVVALLAVNVGYRFTGTGAALRTVPFNSANFQALAHRFPGLPLVLPRGYVQGLDYLSYLSEPGRKVSYFLGRMREGPDWRYFPVALAAKWPLGLLALVVARIAHVTLTRRARFDREIALLVPAGAVLLTAMSTNLDYGLRYVLPMLPYVCVWVAGLASAGGTRRAVSPVWARLAVVLVALEAAESVRALPYPLAFFNLAAGGPGRGDRIVNDSNVDWGQGLLALKAEMRARGIDHVQMLYHGTTDPAIYGIRYLPYIDGKLDPETEYIAVSSYFLVGLPARVVTPHGYSETLRFGFGPLLDRVPDARPAGCMYLFKVR